MLYIISLESNYWTLISYSTLDTLRIKNDLLGVTINYRPINFITVDLLRQLFFGYSVIKRNVI